MSASWSRLALIFSLSVSASRRAAAIFSWISVGEDMVGGGGGGGEREGRRGRKERDLKVQASAGRRVQSQRELTRDAWCGGAESGKAIGACGG